MKIHSQIEIEREGWSWWIEPQGLDGDVIDLVYQEEDGGRRKSMCLGGLADAKALAEGILKYVEIMQGGRE